MASDEVVAELLTAAMAVTAKFTSKKKKLFIKKKLMKKRKVEDCYLWRAVTAKAATTSARGGSCQERGERER